MKIPRKIKKELKKVECLQIQQPSIKAFPDMINVNKITFTQYVGVKFKLGIKVNKWTRLIERNIIRENKRVLQKQIDNEILKKMMSCIPKRI